MKDTRIKKGDRKIKIRKVSSYRQELKKQEQILDKSLDDTFDNTFFVQSNDLLTEYLKASDYLMVSNENQIQKQYDEIQLQNQNDIKFVEGKLFEKENEIEVLNYNDQNKSDAIASLADKIEELVLEIERLKRSKN